MEALSEQFNEFKQKFTDYMTRSILHNYGSLEEFASEKKYNLEELKAYLHCKFQSEEELFKLVWDTNSILVFKDAANNQIFFPGVPIKKDIVIQDPN